MEYLSSRGYPLSESAEEVSKQVSYNLWKTRVWPYREIVSGDVVYWYESVTRRIVWKSRLVDTERFSYDTKDEVRERLGKWLGHFDADEPYFVGKKESGFCLAFKLGVLERWDISAPPEFQFRRRGWCKADDSSLQNWPSLKVLLNSEDDVTLNDIAPEGSLRQRIDTLRDKTLGLSSERIKRLVERTDRGDQGIVHMLKEYFQFQCQFPDCGVRIPKKKGGFYIEVAHIEPFHKGGESRLENLLVLCPNHHKELDFGKFQRLDLTAEFIRFRLNGKEFRITFAT